MKHNRKLGKGDMPTISGNPVDMGLNMRSAIPGGSEMKLKPDTGMKTQRPVAASETMDTSRGDFKMTY